MNTLTRGITTAELADLTGATYRQLDYWTRAGAIDCESVGRYSGRPLSGSGSRRLYDPDLVPAVRTVAAISRATISGGGGLHHAIVCRIIDNYADGRLDLGNGVAITWETS